MMNPNASRPNIVICSSVSDYKSKDKGGAIYELLSDSFIESPQKDLSMYEMVSKEPIKPINKTEYTSSLLAMLENKIEVKFTDEYTFKKLINNPEQKRLIKAIKNYSI